MNFGTLGLTLFDILGFIIPGSMVLFGLSVLEATFFKTGFIGLNNIGYNSLFFLIVSYLLGHLCHNLSALLKIHSGLLRSKANRLDEVTMGIIQSRINEAYRLTPPKAKFSSLETFIYCDSFLVASGCTEERNSLVVREGFYKSSITAFGILALIFIATLFGGGISLQITAEEIQPLGYLFTALMILLSGALLVLFWNRFCFYNRLKINSIYLTFLAITAKPSVPPSK